MLAGEQGETRQKAARLVIDLADSAGASSFIEVDHAHVSGVSVITGGHGLRRFLADLAGDESGVVVIPTTLNSAGCDKEKIAEMGIEWADFLEQQFEIIEAYERLGIEATLSCTPYDRGIELAAGIASWAESNAVCYANSWSSLMTNRESGLSALATALTGYAPLWGLHIEENRRPNIRVTVTCEMSDLTDWSILGDWIGKQVLPEWELPWGVMPLISGLSDHASFAQRKALTSAAANYGCPMLWVEGISSTPTLEADHKWQGELGFTQSDLESRYVDLAPQGRSTSSSSAARRPGWKRFVIPPRRCVPISNWGTEFPTNVCGSSPAVIITIWHKPTAVSPFLRRLGLWYYAIPAPKSRHIIANSTTIC